MVSPSSLLYDAYYHIYNRGINRANIFVEERNYDRFLQLYVKYIEPVAQTFAYCLLRNHFHILVRVKTEAEVNESLRKTQGETLRVSKTLRVFNGSEGTKTHTSIPSKKFSDFFNAYAKSINKAFGRTGSLFQHPFGRVLITNDRQFLQVIAYIHQNPQKHQFVQDFRDWKYSSYNAFLSEKSTRLQRETVLDWFGSKERYIDIHAQWVTEANSKWFAEDDMV